jgi:hypothetical protein
MTQTRICNACLSETVSSPNSCYCQSCSLAANRAQHPQTAPFIIGPQPDGLADDNLAALLRNLL